MATKRIPCSGPGCKDQCPWYAQDKPRGIIWIDVPEDYEGPAYCSIECYLYATNTNVRDYGNDSLDFF